MKKIKKYLFIMSIVVICEGVIIPATLSAQDREKKKGMEHKSEIIQLPDPKYDSKTSIEKALLARRSVREYKGRPLTLAEVGQLLWAAQGITDRRGFRTAPSAGALYPLELYVVAGNVNDTPDGIYKYRPYGHDLIRVAQGDKRVELCNAALGQTPVRDAAAVIVFSAVYERTTGKYGQRGIQYVYMEVGHAAQNICLQTASLNLGTVTIGAFYDETVKRILNMPAKEEPLYIVAVGRR